jgi:hypothetical protein
MPSTCAKSFITHSRSPGLHGSDRVAAVAGDHRRDAVVARRRRVALERDLRIVVRVRVDDAGHDDEAVGVDRLLRAGEASDVRDDAVLDADVRDALRQSRAVHHRAVLDDRIEAHAVHPMYFCSLYASSA